MPIPYLPAKAKAMTNEQLANELEAALARTISGDWSWQIENGVFYWLSADETAVLDVEISNDTPVVEIKPDDANFIVWCHNNAPRIIAALRESGK